jgi:repressor LexA
MSDEEADVLEPLTERQEQVLDYIEDCIGNGMPPTRAEIAAKFDMWPNAAEDILRVLARKKRITLMPGVSRGIKLVTS